MPLKPANKWPRPLYKHPIRIISVNDLNIRIQISHFKTNNRRAKSNNLLFPQHQFLIEQKKQNSLE